MNALLVGNGEMGRALAAVLAARGHTVTTRIERQGEWPALTGAELAFEFTTAAAAPGNLRRLIEAGVPVVCGTTGWSDPAIGALAGRRGVPLLVAPNFSPGAALLRSVAAQAARQLAGFAEYEAAIIERHHSRKRDRPSGTALALRDAIAAAAPGRGAPEIAAVRAGGQPGEHTVVFEGADESFELVHRVRNRAVFAAGAVRAAEWLLAARPAGPVSFDDFLNGSQS